MPPSKVAIGLPACTAAGNGFSDTTIVKTAIDYLRGTGPQPGAYVITQTNGYQSLRGMMTWSINWDAVNTCESTYQYAENFEKIFGLSTSLLTGNTTIEFLIVSPNPSSEFIEINSNISDSNCKEIYFFNSLGKCVYRKTFSSYNESIKISDLPEGIYWIKIQNRFLKFVKQ